MRRLLIPLLFCATLSASVFTADCQDVWTMRRCIDYALDNNLQIRMQGITRETADATLEQSRAAVYPTLNFSSGISSQFQNAQTYNDYMESQSGASFSGNMGLNSGVSLYQGGKLRKTIEQNEIKSKSAAADEQQQMMDVEISVAQAFLQTFYDAENVKICSTLLSLDSLQLARGEALLSAGSISKADLAQLRSQYASDRYQAVNAENSRSLSLLNLKQLLELDMNQPFELSYPEIDETQVFALIPSKDEIYQFAVDSMPQMVSAELNVRSSSLGIDIAKAAGLPSISLNAGLSTGAYSANKTALLQQLGDKLSESVGLNLSIPIINGKQVKTSVKRAQLQYDNALLQQESTRKQLVNTIETLYNEAESARLKYDASKEQLSAAEASYELVLNQFTIGAKNVVELTNEKNNYVSALSQQVQAKCQAVLAAKVLGRYMNIPIEL